MKSNTSLTFQSIYPDHVYISLVNEVQKNPAVSQLPGSNSPQAILADRSILVPRSNINHICEPAVTRYLQENLGLDIQTAYPNSIKSHHLNLLVDGFVVSIAGIRVVFIPSEDLDNLSLEIPQEWIDLPNWAADYYVPMQIDLDHQHLHLWGFITHYQIKEVGGFDRVFRTYTVNYQDLNDDLDQLWLSCELQASSAIVASPTKNLHSPQLLAQVAPDMINFLLQHTSIFSPRLELSFEQWGGILNQPELLETYLNSLLISTSVTNKVLTKLSDWLDRNTTAIYQEWQSLGDFFATPQLQTGMRSPSTAQKVKELTVAPQSNFVPYSKAQNVQELVAMIKNTTSQQERWDAIECLWKLDPNHAALPIYKLLDLGLFFQGEHLSLLVSVITTSLNQLGILIRLSPNQPDAKLPTGIQLQRLDEVGDVSRQIIAQDDDYQCLQLIFDADFGDLFSICVRLQDNQLIKHFQV